MRMKFHLRAQYRIKAGHVLRLYVRRQQTFRVEFMSRIIIPSEGVLVYIVTVSITRGITAYIIRRSRKVTMSRVPLSRLLV